MIIDKKRIFKAIQEAEPLIREYTRKDWSTKEVYNVSSYALFANKTECAKTMVKDGVIFDETFLTHTAYVNWERIYDDYIAVSPFNGFFNTSQGVLVDLYAGWGDDE